MVAAMLATPRYQKGQQVNFLGGSGTIASFQPESGSWVYLIEMAMGPEPAMGRVGSETRVLLWEADLL